MDEYYSLVTIISLTDHQKDLFIKIPMTDGDRISGFSPKLID